MSNLTAQQLQNVLKRDLDAYDEGHFPINASEIILHKGAIGLCAFNARGLYPTLWNLIWLAAYCKLTGKSAGSKSSFP